MPILESETAEQVKTQLAELAGPVRLVMFTQEADCEYCTDTRALVEAVAATSDQVTAEVYDFAAERERADKLGIDKVPAIAVIGAEDYGVRFYGIPGGYEFASLLAAILAVGSGSADLEDETVTFLNDLRDPLHIQVFVTPTCPYCTSAVMLAHRLAIASRLVRSEMVEATEFPQLAVKYEVMGVPRTVINDSVHIEGAAAEAMVVDKLRQAMEVAAGS